MAVSMKKVKPSAPDISTNLTMLGRETSTPIVEEVKQIQTGAPLTQTAGNTKAADKSVTKDTQIIFRTTEDTKNSLKGFFASHGISLSKGVQLACFYLVQQIQSGNVDVTDAGLITKNDKRM